MGLHEAPVSFTQEEVRSKPSVCSGTPSTVLKKKKKSDMERKDSGASELSWILGWGLFLPTRQHIF